MRGLAMSAEPHSREDCEPWSIEQSDCCCCCHSTDWSYHPGRSEACRVMRFVRGLQLLQLSVGQDEVERGDCLADVLRFGGTDDRRGDAGPAGHPGERDLRSGDLPLRGDAGDLLDDHPITGSVEVTAEFVCLAPGGLLVPVTGEPPSGERTP